MNDKMDKYDKLVDLIGDIIKLSSDPKEHECVDEALHTAHIVGDVLKFTTGNNNITHSNGDNSK